MSDERSVVRPLTYVTGALVIALFVSVVLPRYLFPAPVPSRPPLPGPLIVKTFFSTFTTVLLIMLLLTYVRIYRGLPNRFTLGLLGFIVSLMLYALTANPLIALLFGFHPSVTLGPFTFLPNLFASVSVIILLQQSYK